MVAMTAEPPHEDDPTPERGSREREGPVRRKGLIRRDLLDEHAVFVVKRLQREGHEAYLVGGCVPTLELFDTEWGEYVLLDSASQLGPKARVRLRLSTA